MKEQLFGVSNAQQQTNTFRWQKFGLFYLNFSTEFNEVTLNISK